MTDCASPPLSWRGVALYAGLAVGCFHAAYLLPALGWLILPYVVCVAQLARVRRGLYAFLAGLLTALACVAPQLAFFYGIFGAPACTLWTILAAWVAAFVWLLHGALSHLPLRWAACLAPFLWTGLEFFRSERYPLRFSWLNVSYALGPMTSLPFRFFGTYGIGFLAAALAGWVLAGCPRRLWAAGLAALLLATGWLPGPAKVGELSVAGVQLEGISGDRVPEFLDRLVRQYPEAPLYVLSEYSFNGPVPEPVREWCRAHGKYLVAGGEEAAPGGQFYNTAFVVGPTGETVFQQAKSVPIQFFSDGLPAPSQAVWSSPWGKLGLCICYDLSYRRVTDRLIQRGAQALIVPTMDAASWGAHEHDLHTRVAPVRAAEHGVPVFRLASSGVSQAVDARGREITRAPFPGEAVMLFARLSLPEAGRVPFDRFLVPVALTVTGGWIVVWAGLAMRCGWRRRAA